MAEPRGFRNSTFRQKQEAETEAAMRMKFCAYNLSGKRFISNEVTVARGSPQEIKECLEVLGPDSAAGIWILPIRRLLPADFRVPADLLYLDEEYAVLGIVQSFPITRMMQFPGATSILALAAHSAAVAGIEPGNRLLICSPEELQEFLLHLPEPPAEASSGPQLVLPQGSLREELQPDSEDPGTRVWKWVAELDRVEAAGPETSQAQVQDAPREVPARTAVSESLARYVPPKRTFWDKVLMKKSTDPRKAARMALQGLVAYFFTGGLPVPQPVKNISSSGLFLLTPERWYPGTVVRLTLTDEREPTAARSITVHARVVRSMDDGMALQFVLEEPEERVGRVAVSSIDPLPRRSSTEHLEEFIKKFETVQTSS